MKISILLYSFRGGGAERVMITLANGLSGRGHDVEILVADPIGPFASEINSRVDTFVIGGANSFETAYLLWKRIQSTDTGVLFSTMEMPNIISIFVSCFHPSVPVVIQCVSANSNRERSGKYHLIPVLKEALYPKSDRIVTVSDDVAHDIGEITGMETAEMTTIYNPIDVTDIRKKKSEEVNCPLLNHDGDNDVSVILGVGSIKPAKDFPTLLRAVAQLQDEIRLIILGHGPDRESLEELASDLGIEDRVSFPGFVKNPYSYMSKSDVFVLSSAWEGFGNVVVEAMACGLPVVCTDCPGGPSEILNDGEYGPLVPVGDDKMLAEAIKNVLADPIDSHVLQSRAKDFDIEPILGQYEDVLLSVSNNI